MKRWVENSDFVDSNSPTLHELHERAKETLVRYAEAPLGSEVEAIAASELAAHTQDVQRKFEAIHKLQHIPKATIENCIEGAYNGHAAFLLGLNMITVQSWFLTCYDRIADTDYVDTISPTTDITLAYCGVRHVVINTPNFTYVGLGVYGYDRVTINGRDDIYLTTLPLDGLQLVQRQHHEN
jgi:hypothetical protein